MLTTPTTVGQPPSIATRYARLRISNSDSSFSSWMRPSPRHHGPHLHHQIHPALRVGRTLQDVHPLHKDYANLVPLHATFLHLLRHLESLRIPLQVYPRQIKNLPTRHFSRPSVKPMPTALQIYPPHRAAVIKVLETRHPHLQPLSIPHSVFHPPQPPPSKTSRKIRGQL